jgi:hypothetical protein
MFPHQILPGSPRRARCRLFVVGLTAVLEVASYTSARAQEPARLAVADFDFIDTSGEPKYQTAEHARRLQAFGATLENSLSTHGRVALTRLACASAPCSGRIEGLPALSAKAIDTGARFLLVGEVRKMSTLIGGVKFAVVDLTNNTPSCDRFLSYRGDTDEAWQRAAAFTAGDIVKYCLR